MKTTKEAIYRTAIAMFMERGYQNVGLRELCGACGITTGSFYKHFSNKRDLLLRFIMDAYADAMIPSREAVEGKFGRYVDILEEMFERASCVFDEIGPELAKDVWFADLETGNTIMNIKAADHYAWVREFHTLCHEIIELSKQSNEIKTTLPPEDLMFQYYSALFGISISWAASGGSFDFPAERKRLFRLTFR